jgi:UDP-N-acetylmuramoyl-L-alanyl-D-glutamate--2,6-diaminopimelate ligase
MSLASPAAATQLRKPLSALFEGFSRARQGRDVIPAGLSLDSRKVQTGDCFFALRGQHHQASAFVPEALRRGAIAIALDESDEMPDAGIAAVQVPDLRRKLGLIASRFHAEPSLALRVTAVTGTNGKTTVAHLCTEACGLLGEKAAYIGTLGIGPLDALEATGMTTPDPLTLQKGLAQLRDSGHGTVVLEASSHALAQDRLAGTRVQTAVFTGLGHDHLDYHPDLAHYRASKARLFRHPGLSWAVLNADDPATATMVDVLAPEVRRVFFSRRAHAPALRNGDHLIALRHADYSAHGSQLRIDVDGTELRVRSSLLGDFNAENLLATLGVLLTQGYDPLALSACLDQLHPVKGRLETFGTETTPRIIVDFAHSPDSLERVLLVLRGFAPRRLTCVFGCGGDRDRSKRPLMGAIAGRLADDIILTNDNPRSEDPADIAAAIRSGIPATVSTAFIPDRAEAIDLALSRAAAGDIVLVAGKGHESTQEVAGEHHPFSDQAHILAWLGSRA